MGFTIDDTLIHILLLTRHLRKGDVQSAILALMIELGFSSQSDGFGYLRKAIFLKFEDPDQRLGTIYHAVGNRYEPQISHLQVEQAIRAAIDAAWENRNEQIWSCLFPANVERYQKKPSNGEFVSRFACLMELWYSCSKEVSYVTK